MADGRMRLDMGPAHTATVSETFSSLHARALSHATEDPKKVERAMLNVFGDIELRTTRTEGHHGNPILVIEAHIADMRTIDGFFRRLTEEDVELLASTLARRIDEGCSLYLKLDKQRAFLGEIRLGSGDDVISVRAKVRAFPARCEVAQVAVLGYLKELLLPRADVA